MADNKGWKLVATRGTGYYLVQVKPGVGRVLHPGGFGPEEPLDSILKWGYWEAADDQGPLEAALRADAPVAEGPSIPERRVEDGNAVPA